MEFHCPYCKLWITDTVHKQHYHNNLDEVDSTRDYRVRVDGIVYETEEGALKPRYFACSYCGGKFEYGDAPKDIAGPLCPSCGRGEDITELEAYGGNP